MKHYLMGKYSPYIKISCFKLCMVLILILCFHNDVFAKIGDGEQWDKMKAGTLPVKVYAKILEHQRANNLLIGEGYVDIYYGSLRLQADKVRFNTVTGQVIAEGNVILDEGANRITGEKMEVNIHTKLGSIYDGAGSLESGYYFTGKKIDRTAVDEFIIYDGSYTSCDQPLPDWSLKSKKCRLHIENYAYLNHFTMRVKDVPIFYSPYGIFPIKTKRSSGFLIPRLGQSSQDGFFIKNYYFWAINDWSDATFGVDYYNKRGIGKSVEGRYALTDRDYGQVNAYHIDDEIENKERWQLQVDAKQQFPGDINSVLWVDAFSDRRFDRQFADRVAQRNRQEQETYFSFTKNWESYNVNLWGNQFKDLYQEQKTVSRRLPELNFNSTSHRLGESPLFIEWETAWAALEKRVNNEVVLRTQRANLHPRLSLPWRIGNGMVFTPSVGYWSTWYTDVPGDSGGAVRDLYDVKLQFDGPQMYRTFDFDGWDGMKKFKHIVYPNITYTYIPYKDQNYLYNFDDGLDRVAPAYRFDYSIINHFLGKFEREGGQADIRDFLTVTLSQSFNMAEERRMVNLDTNPRRPFSDLKLDVEIKPVSSIRLDVENYYDVYEHYFDRVNTDLWFEPQGQKWAITGGWRYEKSAYDRPQGNDFVRGGGRIRLGAWEFQASLSHDLKETQRVENRFKIEYFSQCWSIALNHVTRPDEDEIGLMINLTGLGSMGN